MRRSSIDGGQVVRVNRKGVLVISVRQLPVIRPIMSCEYLTRERGRYHPTVYHSRHAREAARETSLALGLARGLSSARGLSPAGVGAPRPLLGGGDVRLCGGSRNDRGFKVRSICSREAIAQRGKWKPYLPLLCSREDIWMAGFQEALEALHICQREDIVLFRLREVSVVLMLV